LITSSLTMAWGVRLAQLGRQSALVLCLALTIAGGYVFMGIKSIEYQTKWKHSLWLGKNSNNMYVPRAYDQALDRGKELAPGGGAPSVGEPKDEGEEHKGAEHKDVEHKGPENKPDAGEHKESNHKT